eukprot:CAMPEP_0194205964 /NCGR_PEP_ID=MMETSP0156-20130528/5113_1 /TAXON_ID=33649 /ORGANISM="Thalassionema nitzschioides, Strain L26-B" /LENGTH=171 /DNA_ID=CAMNT_0038932367 /DNA_START=41 /DNA_END=556 /DNA_ORIENTATION=+
MRSQATARRVVRTLTTRNLDWTAPVFKGDAEVASQVTQFRSWVAAAEIMAEKYSSPPAPIDFASAKESVDDKALIESLEKIYNSSTPPPETHEWAAEDRSSKDAQIEEAKARLAFTQEMIADTEREIAFMEANRTTRETSATELAEVYPDIAEEIEDEIDRREWFKDTVAK